MQVRKQKYFNELTQITLRRNYGCVSMCSSFQFHMNKKESVIYEFEMDFKKSFCCCFNLSSDDIISVLSKNVMLRFVTTSMSENGYGFQRPGLKKTFFGLKQGQDFKNRAAHPSQEFPGVSLPGDRVHHKMECFACCS